MKKFEFTITIENVAQQVIKLGEELNGKFTKCTLMLEEETI